MAKYTFPAVFEPDEEVGGFCVYFPDITSVNTQGDDFKDAMDNAEDALCLMLYEMEKDGETIPKASNTNEIKTKDGSIINLVACDTKFYKNYFEGKSVKINATIPLWLKEEGEKRHVNFSQILQRGVKEYLSLK